jgi:hypothetical protein
LEDRLLVDAVQAKLFHGQMNAARLTKHVAANEARFYVFGYEADFMGIGIATVIHSKLLLCTFCVC